MSTDPTPRSICLLGRDYPELGPLATVGLDDGGAIALSRGALPKAYAHKDPNEDGALLVRTPRGALIAVADGHHGAAASEVALGATRSHAQALLSDDEGVFQRAIRELIEDISVEIARHGASRTCLVLAALCNGHCNAASFGDSSVFRGSLGDMLTVADNRLILGPEPPRLDDLSQWFLGFDCEPDERVAVVTDGVTNFVPRTSGIARLLRESADDLAAAKAVALAAMYGGAGDNVAVATIAAPPRL